MTGFDDLIWHADRMTLDGWIFRIQDFTNEPWMGDEEHFRFYKSRDIMNQYSRFWTAHRALAPGFRPRRVLELGIWDGASAALWCELLGPDKLVAIDNGVRSDGRYLTRFRQERGHEQRLKTVWSTCQTDKGKLDEIISNEFGGSLDVIIDDASHDLASTETSFEILFPRLVAGGLYAIEDWSWPHWHDFQDERHSWAMKAPLSMLIQKLLRAAGTTLDGGARLIEGVSVQQGLVVVERGHRELDPGRRFTLADYSLIRPQDFDLFA